MKLLRQQLPGRDGRSPSSSARSALPGNRPHGLSEELNRCTGLRGVATAAALLLSVAGASTAADAQVYASGLIAQSFDLGSVPAPVLEAIARGGPPVSTLSLSALVDAQSVADLDEQANCLATAVYFESKGEPLEGQLAVAQVVINRAASGRYPTSLCGVVKQHAQFSFVRNRAFPRLNANCDGWRKARAIARIAQQRLVVTVPANVLWYHANYVTPRWRQSLMLVERIGAHIFYRS